MKKNSLLGIDKKTFLQLCDSLLNGTKFPQFQLDTAFRLGHLMGIERFESVIGIPKQLRSVLDEHFAIDIGSISKQTNSLDGTIKWAIKCGQEEGSIAESVLIPEYGGRNTLCLSSQIGCSLACKFCCTGTQRLMRNLTASEIVAQFIQAALHLKDIPMSKAKGFRSLTNIVFMGQGEPLYNWSNVSQAIQTFVNPELYALSPSRITVSTSGIAPLIPKIGELGVQLAVSLHAPTDSLRSDIMDINRTYPLAALIEACKEFLRATHGRSRITFEYVMLRNFNDSERCAQDLARLLNGMNAFVNLM